jgi:methyl-accepting chemotaxis protein
MALVKTSKLSSKTLAASASIQKPTFGSADKPASRSVTSRWPSTDSRENALERIGAATEELATAIAEASTAARDLSASMEQIASGALEAASAAQSQLTAIKVIFDRLRTARGEAESLRRRAERAQILLSETSRQIITSARAIERSAVRQEETVEIIVALERRASEIGGVTETVSSLSDQTDLLALNAAIEAARAGNHGRGFAVVAGEIRLLAEMSDKSAREVKQVSESILNEIRSVVVAVKKAVEASAAQSRDAVSVAESLLARQSAMAMIAKGSEETLTAATEAEQSISEAQKGAEQVSVAAEQQSAGATEAQSAIQQQADALAQGKVAARSLAGLAERLRGGSAEASAAEQIASAAEQLSAAIQEISYGSSQIMGALQQIESGAQQQSAATHQTSVALAQIESAANSALAASAQAEESISRLVSSLKEGRASVERLVEGVNVALAITRSSVASIKRMEGFAQGIETAIDGIALLAMQIGMLAVSGSIEAAREGDAGRGFAVVSGEIRNLAKAASSNVEIAKANIRGIRDQVAMLRRDLEQVISVTEIEARSNLAILSALGSVDSEFAALDGANRAISEGAQASLLAAREGAAGAAQIAAAAEQSRNAARSAATASAEQARGAEDLAAAIEEIAQLGEVLKQRHAWTAVWSVSIKSCGGWTRSRIARTCPIRSPRRRKANRLVARLSGRPTGGAKVETRSAGGTNGAVSSLPETILREQLRVLAMGGVASEGAIASAGRVAENALRHLGRLEAARQIEAAMREGLVGLDPRPLIAAVEHALAEIERTAQPPSEIAARPSPESRSRTLRVAAERIGALADLAGELTAAKNALGHLAQRASDERNPLAGQLKKESDRLDRLINLLRIEAIGLRVLPLRTVFQRFPRLVREISTSLGKPVRLVTEGDETEADKTIVEALFDPLLHMVRNAVDHGVEPPSERAAAGKPRIATIGLRARRENDRVIVDVEDDGRGVDLDRIRRVAVERGLAASERVSAMPDDEAVNLIFVPGLSTAPDVSALWTPFAPRSSVSGAALRSSLAPARARLFASSFPSA